MFSTVGILLVVVAVPTNAVSAKDIVKVEVTGFPVTVTPPEPRIFILFAVGGTGPPVSPVSVSTTIPPLPPIFTMPACEITTSLFTSRNMRSCIQILCQLNL